MNLMTLDFWGIAVLALFASLLFIGYRLTLRLARWSEDLIGSLVQMNLHGLARTLLQVLIAYDEHTYQGSRFIWWNQVRVRFALLWGGTLLLTGLVLLLQIRSIVWIPPALAFIAYRLVVAWQNPTRPPIHTQDPVLKDLIQDVNEPVRPGRQRRTQPIIRRWDYLDELFAESV
ncbi:hypothetical protein GCM10023187_53660 [Nibrella viscosa]|uniref:Uncharacterized protein n=1 Tax=Nibrella viscosa TaxID=1084524 RepID=A0ABP8KZH0_9BACT